MNITYHPLNEVQGIDRTLADKVFAICDYYIQSKTAKHSRHLYDIYKLLPLVPQDEKFRQLIQEVRAVRAQSVVCPSAQPEVNISDFTSKKLSNEKSIQTGLRCFDFAIIGRTRSV